MAQKTWQGDLTAVAHVWKGTFGTSTGGHTYTITLTDEQTNTHAYTYTVTGSEGSTTAVAAAFVSAWNAHTAPYINAVTASNSGAVLTLTGEAGVPLTIANTTSSGSWSSAGTTTTGTGPNDWGNAGNWFEGSLPVADDDVDIPAGTSSILYNLDSLIGVDFNSFEVHPGYTGTIGGTDGDYLMVDLQTAKTAIFAGTGTAYIEFRADGDDFDLHVNNTATPSSVGSYGLYLKGESYDNLYINKGNVGLGIVPWGADTEVVTIHVGYVSDRQNDVTLTIGEGVRHTGGGSNAPILKQRAGTVISHDNIGVSEISGGTYIQEKKGTWGANTEITGDAIVELNAPPQTGNILAFKMDDTAQVLNEKDTSSKTVDAVTVKADGVTIRDPNGLLTWNGTTSIDFAGCAMSGTTLDIGRDKKIVITDS